MAGHTIAAPFTFGGGGGGGAGSKTKRLSAPSARTLPEPRPVAGLIDWRSMHSSAIVEAAVRITVLHYTRPCNKPFVLDTQTLEGIRAGSSLAAHGAPIVVQRSKTGVLRRFSEFEPEGGRPPYAGSYPPVQMRTWTRFTPSSQGERQEKLLFLATGWPRLGAVEGGESWPVLSTATTCRRATCTAVQVRLSACLRRAGLGPATTEGCLAGL